MQPRESTGPVCTPITPVSPERDTHSQTCPCPRVSRYRSPRVTIASHYFCYFLLPVHPGPENTHTTQFSRIAKILATPKCNHTPEPLKLILQATARTFPSSPISHRNNTGNSRTFGRQRTAAAGITIRTASQQTHNVCISPSPAPLSLSFEIPLSLPPPRVWAGVDGIEDARDSKPRNAPVQVNPPPVLKCKKLGGGGSGKRQEKELKRVAA